MSSRRGAPAAAGRLLPRSWRCPRRRSSVSAFVRANEVKYVGGWSKSPGEHPDILHSFYSLAWKALAQDGGGVGKLDNELVVRADRAAALRARQRQEEQISVLI